MPLPPFIKNYKFYSSDKSDILCCGIRGTFLVSPHSKPENALAFTSGHFYVSIDLQRAARFRTCLVLSKCRRGSTVYGVQKIQLSVTVVNARTVPAFTEEWEDTNVD